MSTRGIFFHKKRPFFCKKTRHTTEYNMKKCIFTFVCAWLSVSLAYAQVTNLRLTLSDVKSYGKEGDTEILEAKIKVTSGSINDDVVQLAYPLADGKMGFARLETFGERFTAGQSSASPLALKVIGFKPANGQTLVSHDLAQVKLPANRTFKFEAKDGFLGDDPHQITANIAGLQGYLAVGDEFEYINLEGKKGRAKVEAIDVDFGTMTSQVAFEGLPDYTFNLHLRRADSKVSFSGVKAYSMGTAPAAPTEKPAVATSKAKVKTLPLNVVLENKEVKITVHNLVKYNPSPDEGLDLFKVDYSLDYYIVDATLENKTTQPLDCGEYLLRFNFFTPDGQSADEFTRLFKKKSQNPNEASQEADQVDVQVFGGTGKIVMANVLAKYQLTVPDYDAKHKANTDAINKPLAPGQKIRSIDATIMGVPSTYSIVGLGTWSGTFFSKKNLLFVPVKLP
jgi:hypothetical protein